MINSIGANTEMVTASVSVGLSQAGASCEYNNNLEPFKLALTPEAALPPLEEGLNSRGLTSRQRRMLRLATPALNEVMTHYVLDQPLTLFLAGPETLPGSSSALRSDFISLLSEQTGIEFDKSTSRMFSGGRASGFEAIDMAFRFFQATGQDYALIGGVDTYLGLELLATLDKQKRLLSDGVADGFIGGESSGFLLVMSEQARQKTDKQPLLALSYPGMAEEPGHYYSDEPYKGEGLANAFRQAIINCDVARIETLYTGLNGENYGAKEIGVAKTRNNKGFAKETKIEHFADCFGDIGAAFVPVLTGIIAHRQQVAERQVMLTCSSDGPLRGAVLINKPAQSVS